MKKYQFLLLVSLFVMIITPIFPVRASAEQEVAVKSMAFTAKSYKLGVNGTGNLTTKLRITPANASNKAVTWVSSNSAVVSIDADGQVTAKRNGSAKITAISVSNPSKKASCKITVTTTRVKSIKLNTSDASLQVGTSGKLTATITPSNASYKDIEWVISDSSIATVEADGTVTGLKMGRVTITAKTDKGRASAKMTLQVRDGNMTDPVRVTITAVGDITIGGDPRKSASIIGSQGYYDRLYKSLDGKFLQNVAPYFKGANNVTIANLETSFTTSTRYKNKGYIFRAKPAYAAMLANAGIDIVGHANNHAEDCANGIPNTRSAVSKAGMQYVGNGTFAYAERNGVRIGFLAYNGGHSKMSESIKKMKQQCDLVVVSIHWGKEWVYAASASQRNLGRGAITAGADLVIGHHSHVVSGIEKYKGKYIVYGLGTLSSAILTPSDMDTFIYQQTFEVIPATGEINEGSVELIPCSTSSDPKRNNGMTKILSGDARDRVLGKIKRYSNSFPATLPASIFK